MVGNDVVDLRDPDSDWASYSSRFDERAFCADERDVIARDADRERCRWRLWAAKEAAYKLVRRADDSAIFSPPRFEVTCEGFAGARVRSPWGSCGVAFSEGKDWIHAVASRSTRPDASVLSEVVELLTRGAVAGLDEMPDASAAVRDRVKHSLSRRFGLAENQLEVRRRDRVPELWCEGRRLPVDLSLSHHGRFVAFACAVPR